MELHLPVAVPFVKGSPADYTTMNIVQLKRFINFLYRSSFNKELPVRNSRYHSQSMKPAWWSSSISFERDLILKIDDISLFTKEKHRKELGQIIYKYYESLGIPSLIDFVRDLSKIKSWLQYERSGDKVNLVNKITGNTLIVVSRENQTYDIQTDQGRQNLKERESSTKEPTLAGKSSTSAIKKSREKQAKKSTNEITQATKKQLVKKAEIKYICCKYCQQPFHHEFLEGHEEKCSRRPLEPSSESSSSESLDDSNKLELINALGLCSIQHGEAQETKIGKTTDGKEYPEVSPPTHTHSLHALTKAQSKKRLASFTNSRTVPLTSCVGQKILCQLGGKVTKYPPPYDNKKGQPPKQYRLSSKSPEGQYDTVTKRKIIKDGLKPHIYSLGRRQMVERYQELVIGLNKSSWKHLNSLKKPRLVLEKVKVSSYGVFKLTPELAFKSHLERAFRAAIQFPRVKLIDFLNWNNNVLEEQSQGEIRKLRNVRNKDKPKPDFSPKCENNNDRNSFKSLTN